MRHSIWTAGMALVAFAILGWFGTPGITAAPPLPAKITEKPLADDRDDLANKLLERVTLNDAFKNVALKEVLEFVTVKYEITVLIDAKSFGGGGGAPAAVVAADEDGILSQLISVPAMKNVRLGTLLKVVADQIDGVYLVYPDHIKLVGTARAIMICEPLTRASNSPNDAPLESNEATFRSIPLLTTSFHEKSLADALRDVEIRSNRTIVLANQAADKAKTTISARFTNVPVDSAVMTLAEMAGLTVARKGNVLLVTTAERAKDFDPAPPAPPTNLGGGGGCMFGFAADPAAVEFRKRIAELEKTVEELKAKK